MQPRLCRVPIHCNMHLMTKEEQDTMTKTAESRETTASPSRVRLGSLSLALSGILFLLYPALRPFSNEASLQGAEAFASPFWVLAHMLAVVGFILLALGLLGLHSALQNTTVERLMFVALVLTWIGVGFTLPYYCAEIFACMLSARKRSDSRALHCWLWSIPSVMGQQSLYSQWDSCCW